MIYKYKSNMSIDEQDRVNTHNTMQGRIAFVFEAKQKYVLKK